MAWIDDYRSAIESCRQRTLFLVQELDDRAFAWKPRHDANSIAWILWHIGEFEESILWNYYRQSPIYRFKVSCLQSDGSTVPSRDALLDYQHSTRKAFLAFLDSVRDADLDELRSTQQFGTISLKTLLELPLHHEYYHQGQIAYIRRLMGRPVAAEESPFPFHKK